MTTTVKTQFTSDFLNVLNERGFIAQATNLEELDRRAASETLTGYIGFDATAKSLHAGGLLQIMMLYWMQHTGHRPIALMGGGTTKVGDPTGKDQQRLLLTDAQIQENMNSIKGVFETFLKFGDGGTDGAELDGHLPVRRLQHEAEAAPELRGGLEACGQAGEEALH